MLELVIYCLFAWHGHISGKVPFHHLLDVLHREVKGELQITKPIFKQVVKSGTPQIKCQNKLFWMSLDEFRPRC